MLVHVHDGVYGDGAFLQPFASPEEFVSSLMMKQLLRTGSGC